MYEYTFPNYPNETKIVHIILYLFAAWEKRDKKCCIDFYGASSSSVRSITMPSSAILQLIKKRWRSTNWFFFTNLNVAHMFFKSKALSLLKNGNTENGSKIGLIAERRATVDKLLHCIVNHLEHIEGCFGSKIVTNATWFKGAGTEQ